MAKKSKSAILFSLILSLLFVFIFASAQQERPLEVNYPAIGQAQPTDLPAYVKYIFNFAIIAAGFILLGSLIYGGFLYLIAAGQPDKLKDAKDQISSALLGAAILLSGYIILSIINPELVILKLPSLEEIKRTQKPELNLPPPDKITLISRELPQGQSIDGEQGIWSEKKTDETKNLLTDFEKFLKEDTQVNPTFNRISDLNKYLKTLTEECQCGNSTQFCTKPQDWSLPIGCAGDPCLPKTREKIEEILNKNEEKIKKLLDFQKRIAEEKKGLELTLNKFSEVEQEISACKYQDQRIYSLFQYLELKSSYEESGNKTVALPYYFQAKQDPLTFYCSVGGTAFDAPYTYNKPELSLETNLENLDKNLETPNFVQQPKSCPIEIPLGSVADNLRELKILQLVKMERINILIEEMVTEIRDMAGLVSQCNETRCKANCSCIENPCYLCCSPIPCGGCVPFCQSRCLQAVGGCSGEACPRKEIGNIVDKIKKTEDEIFSTLSEIKNIFNKADFALKEPENPINLKNLRTSVLLCASPVDPETLTADWELLDCKSAIGNYGPDGAIIGACHPRNYFCCTPTGAKEPGFPSAVKKGPATSVFQKTYTELKVNDQNCPEGWICDQKVTKDNQYKDASKPLKQLLSCMRQRLNAAQKEKDIKETLGRITNITDPKIYQGTCDWVTGPSKEGGCSFPHTIKEGKSDISAHYGGPLCNWERVSYAVDIGVSTSFEKKYADEIIEAAKECSPSAYIQYLTSGSYGEIHISVAGVNNCGVD